MVTAPPTITYAFPPLAAADAESVARALGLELQRAWDRAEVQRQRVLLSVEEGAKANALRRLAEYQKAIEAYQEQIPEIAREYVRVVVGEYAAGAAVGAAAVGISNTWTMADRNALASLASDSYGDLLRRSQDAGRTAREFARAVRATAGEFIPAGASGDTLVKAGREWRKALEERHRVSSVVYADGSMRSIQDYTEMAVRTKGRVAYNSGALARYADAGVGYVEVFDGPNCFMPGQSFSPSGAVLGMVRSRYSGGAYTITARTLTGTDSFTVGPNHPVLTRRGWVRAHLLHEGDELAYRTPGENSLALAELDLEKGAMGEDVFAALAQLFPRSIRPTARGEFHGDETACYGEVEVVGPKGFLLEVGDPCCVEHGRERNLMGADASAPILPSESGALRGRRVHGDAPGRALSGRYSRGPAVASGRSLGDAQGVATSTGDSSVLDERVDLSDGAPHSLGYQAGSHSAEVEGDGFGLLGREHGWSLATVADVAVEHYEGWVYDGWTEQGHYALNGFTVKNCGWTQHDDDDLAHGSIRSAEEAAHYVIAHPRCRRSFGPRPDVTTERDRAEAQPFNDTPMPEAQPAMAQTSARADNGERRRAAAAARRARRAG